MKTKTLKIILAAVAISNLFYPVCPLPSKFEQ